MEKAMKCPVCKKGEMEILKDKIDQDGVAFEVYRCRGCGEEIMTMPQLKKLADKYRQLRKTKEIRFSKWGNSLAVRIPKDIAEDLNLREGKHGFLTKEKEGIKITPI